MDTPIITLMEVPLKLAQWHYNKFSFKMTSVWQLLMTSVVCWFVLLQSLLQLISTLSLSCHSVAYTPGLKFFLSLLLAFWVAHLDGSLYVQWHVLGTLLLSSPTRPGILRLWQLFLCIRHLYGWSCVIARATKDIPPTYVRTNDPSTKSRHNKKWISFGDINLPEAGSAANVPGLNSLVPAPLVADTCTM